MYVVVRGSGETTDQILTIADSISTANAILTISGTNARHASAIHMSRSSSQSRGPSPAADATVVELLITPTPINHIDNSPIIKGCRETGRERGGGTKGKKVGRERKGEGGRDVTRKQLDLIYSPYNKMAKGDRRKEKLFGTLISNEILEY